MGKWPTSGSAIGIDGGADESTEAATWAERERFSREQSAADRPADRQRARAEFRRQGYALDLPGIDKDLAGLGEVLGDREYGGFEIVSLMAPPSSRCGGRLRAWRRS